MRHLIPLALVFAFAIPTHAEGYPRIASLWGCSAAVTDYDKWARYGLLVLGGGGPEQFRHLRAELRKRNPDIILLTTGFVSYTSAPAQTPWMKDEWYLRRPNGEKLSWWAGQCFVPNLMDDACLDALVAQTEKTCGDLFRDGTLDGIFYDSMVGGVTWLGEVDTNGDGKADLAQDVDAQWHARQNLFLDRIRALHPKTLIMANDVDAGHAPHLNGRLYEGGPLLDRMTSGALLPGDAISTLDTWMTTSLQPAITFAIMTHPLGWQGWRVGQGQGTSTKGEAERVRRDFSRMRFGLTTTLMSDAYYSYDFGTVWYGLPYWYGEYSAPLGKPLGPGREVFEVPPVTLLDWQAGQPADAFLLESMSKATPEGLAGEMTDEQGGWQCLFNTNAEKLRLEPGKQYRIDAEVEVTRKTNHAFQFDVRTPTGGWEKHDKGIVSTGVEVGPVWRVGTTIVPDNYDDYRLEWHVLGAGGLRLKSLKVQLVGQSYFIREFEGGLALLNPLSQPVSLKLPRPMKRLKDDEAPRHIVEVDDADANWSGSGAWEMRAGETHYYGAGYRLAAKPGSAATWSFVAPSADEYTIFATAPGSPKRVKPGDILLTDAAAYDVVAPAGGGAINIKQRAADGGWMKLFTVKLKQGEKCVVRLRSGGTGATAADAIRAESAARYNDGATVTSVDLGPLDGVVLVKP